MDVLKEAVDAAKKNNILTLVVASTSGNTASKLFDMTRGEKLKLIVVTHDERMIEGFDRVAVLAKNRWEYAALYYAAARVDAWERAGRAAPRLPDPADLRLHLEATNLLSAIARSTPKPSIRRRTLSSRPPRLRAQITQG